MKASNKILLAVLIVLGAVYGIIVLTEGDSKSDLLKSELVSINPNKITSIKIDRNSGNAELKKENGIWKVKIDNEKWKVADSSQIQSTVSSIEKITPDRLVSRNREKRSEYQVDSTGTRLLIYEDDQKTLDIIIGKLGMSGQNQYHTFVRLADNDDIFSVNDFMSFSISADPNNYRNQQVIRFVRDSLREIVVNYSGIEKYSIEKTPNGYWSIDDMETDSTAVQEFITAVSYKTDNQFFDDVETDELGVPHSEVSLILNNGEIFLKGFIQNGDTLIYSSFNPENIFRNGKYFNELFKPKSVFLP